MVHIILKTTISITTLDIGIDDYSVIEIAHTLKENFKNFNYGWPQTHQSLRINIKNSVEETLCIAKMHNLPRIEHHH